ncbi:MAG TPA: hypothetical protein ENN33_04310, partial [Ignavibacteria bacterium]|nr:hypothetical protein [Ignavibacteria bacterium]
MSLAYKLWKIGSVLTEEDIRSSIEDTAEHDSDFLYFNIDFIVEDNKVKDIRTNENAISKDKMFFTKKIGGSGPGIYYLYPNLNLKKSILSDKVSLLVNTLHQTIIKYSHPETSELCSVLKEAIKHFDKHIERAETEAEIESYQKENNENKLVKRKADHEKLLSVLNKNEWNDALLRVSTILVSKEKGDYWFWFSVNGKTFWELMPEVWENWYKCPLIKNDTAKEGYDIFTNKLTEIGYRPEIKVFSYDNYHDSLNFRINENLAISLDSARYIKFAWLYILEHLVFYYKGLEYVIIPNLLSDNRDAYSIILKRLRLANENSSNKITALKTLTKEEEKLEKELKEIDKKMKKEQDVELLLKHSELQKKISAVEEKIIDTDLGIISEFNEQIDQIGELKDSITVDYLFTEINRTNLSFSIKGSMEDVIPSHIRSVVKAMKNNKIDDLIKLGKRNKNFTLLQDFFHRDELYLILNKSAKNNRNKILSERLHLAHLLLTDEIIKIDDLLKRFE